MPRSVWRSNFFCAPRGACFFRNGLPSHRYYNTNEGLKPLVNSEEVLLEALDVMGGELTCCRLGHPDGDPCDREELMLPMLGLCRAARDVFATAAASPRPVAASDLDGFGFEPSPTRRPRPVA